MEAVNLHTIIQSAEVRKRSCALDSRKVAEKVVIFADENPRYRAPAAASGFRREWTDILLRPAPLDFQQLQALLVRMLPVY